MTPVSAQPDTCNIVVEIRGGNVVALYCDLSHANVVLLDWDNNEAGDTTGGIDVIPLSDMPDDTRREYTRALGLPQ